MASCKTSKIRDQNTPEFYPLTQRFRSSAPGNLHRLKRWLTDYGRHPTWDGKMYVASTIYWDEDSSEFRQTGCSPNYQAGWWSLACCKHDMRTARPFRDKATDLSIPTYVFTLAKQHPAVGQALVSVAQVTEHSFDTMADYAEFLLTGGDRALTSSRLTRVRHDDGLLGWRFGDCHSDKFGHISRPYPEHVHHEEKYWETDINGEHIILASHRFLVWPEPVFVARTTQKQSRFGKDIDLSTLDNLIRTASSN
jgi:hypothetical protein